MWMRLMWLRLWLVNHGPWTGQSWLWQQHRWIKKTEILRYSSSLARSGSCLALGLGALTESWWFMAHGSWFSPLADHGQLGLVSCEPTNCGQDRDKPANLKACFRDLGRNQESWKYMNWSRRRQITKPNFQFTRCSFKDTKPGSAS